MVRQYQGSDIEAVLDIWLRASIEAHDFVAAAFWESQLDDMRNLYIPGSETWVYEQEGAVLGFYSLCDNHLAAIFVEPQRQGLGIGKLLLAHAKAQRESLTLSVYQENQASCGFYLSQGFRIVSEQAEPHTGRMEYTMRAGE